MEHGRDSEDDQHDPYPRTPQIAAKSGNPFGSPWDEGLVCLIDRNRSLNGACGERCLIKAPTQYFRWGEQAAPSSRCRDRAASVVIITAEPGDANVTVGIGVRKA